MKEESTITTILLAPLRALGHLLYKALMGLAYAVVWVYVFITYRPSDAQGAEN